MSISFSCNYTYLRWLWENVCLIELSPLLHPLWFVLFENIHYTIVLYIYFYICNHHCDLILKYNFKYEVHLNFFILLLCVSSTCGQSLVCEEKCMWKVVCIFFKSLKRHTNSFTLYRKGRNWSACPFPQ